MNRNSSTESQLVMKDGTRLVLKHRNSFGGYLNALQRAGWDANDVDHDAEFWTEADRVAV